jgi:uncharacterized membrane protein
MKLHKNWFEKHQDSMSLSDMVSDSVTRFAGTMRFLYVHFVWWGGWFIVNSKLTHLTFDKYPYNLLTMVLSLEAIVLATLIMISQNRQAARDKVQAEHQYETQEVELKENTELTREVHAMAKAQAKHIEETQKRWAAEDSQK